MCAAHSSPTHLPSHSITPARVSYYLRSRDPISIQRASAIQHAHTAATAQASANRAGFKLEQKLASFEAQRALLRRTHGLHLDAPALDRVRALLGRLDYYKQSPRPSSQAQGPQGPQGPLGGSPVTLPAPLADDFRWWRGLSDGARADVGLLLQAQAGVRMGVCDVGLWDRLTGADAPGREERERETRARFARRRYSGALGVARAARRLRRGARRGKVEEDGAEDDREWACAGEEKGKERDYKGKGKGRR